MIAEPIMPDDLDLTDLVTLVDQWEWADEQVIAFKTYRELILSLLREKVIASGKFSLKVDNDRMLRLIPRYYLACTTHEGIDIRECGCANVSDGKTPTITVTQGALTDPRSRWLSIERPSKRSKAPRLFVLDGGKDDND